MVIWFVCTQGQCLWRTQCECVVAHVVGVSGDSSVRCHLDERSLGLGGQPDGGLGGVTDGDN